jgi:hypothetical protein
MHGGTGHVYFGNYIGVRIVGDGGLSGAIIGERKSYTLIGDRGAAFRIFKIVGAFQITLARNILYGYIDIVGR